MTITNCYEGSITAVHDSLGNASITEAADVIAAFGGVATYTGFRLYITAINGGTTVDLAEVSFSTDAATNTNFMSGGTAISSEGVAANAFDGNMSNHVLMPTLPAYVGMIGIPVAKLPQLMTIHSSPGANNQPTVFKAQATTDGSNWVDIGTVTWPGFCAYAGSYYHSIFPLSGEAWMLEITNTRAGVSTVYLSTMELRNGGGTNLLTGGIPFASSTANTSTGPDVLLDGDTTTYYSNNVTWNAIGSSTVRVGYIMPLNTSISPVTLYLAGDAGISANYYPSSFTLKKLPIGVYANNTGWQTVGTYTWNAGLSTTITL